MSGGKLARDEAVNSVRCRTLPYVPRHALDPIEASMGAP